MYSQVQEKNKFYRQLYNHEPLDAEQIAEQVLATQERLLPHIKDVLPIIRKALAADQKVCWRDSWGLLEDLDWGTCM